jgi:pimeloyl-ACP methyl ester carboxylesterase
VPDTPRWYRAALADAPEHRDTTVDGTGIHLRCWGAEDRPGLVFVHGGAAHSGWWDHVAPFFAGTHRVVALDLSGHGDSGRRQAYGMEAWADEVVAVAVAGGIATPPLVVGHSMGGWVAATAGVRHGDELDGIAIIDSPLREPPPEEEVLRRRRRGTRVYPTRAEILARFTTLPPQDVVLPYVRDHIAEQSVRPVDGGWGLEVRPGAVRGAAAAAGAAAGAALPGRVHPVRVRAGAAGDGRHHRRAAGAQGADRGAARRRSPPDAGPAVAAGHGPADARPAVGGDLNAGWRPDELGANGR